MHKDGLIKKREQFHINIRQGHIRKAVKEWRLQIIKQLDRKQQKSTINAPQTIKQIKFQELNALSHFLFQIKSLRQNIFDNQQIYSNIIQILKGLMKPSEAYHRKILQQFFSHVFNKDKIKGNYKNSYSLLNILNLNYLNNSQIKSLQEIARIDMQQIDIQLVVFLIIILKYNKHPLFQFYINQSNISSLVNMITISNVSTVELLLLFFVNLTYQNDEYIHILISSNILSKFLITLEFGSSKQKLYTLTLIHNILTVKQLNNDVKYHGIFNKLIEKMHKIKFESFQVQQQLCCTFIQYVFNIKTESDFNHFDQYNCFSLLINILTYQFSSKKLKALTMQAIYHIIIHSNQKNSSQLKNNPYFIALETQKGIIHFQKLYNEDPNTFFIAETILNLNLNSENK